MFLAQPAAHAQATDLSARLPGDTVLYLYWRGEDSLRPGNRNAIISLWNDPGFQPVRRMILRNLVDAAARDPRLARTSPREIEELLADPFVFGIRLAGGGAKPSAHGFLVLRAEGKPGQDLRAELQGGSGKKTSVRFTSSGLLLASGDPSTLHELARQFGGSGRSAVKPLSTLAAYQEARAEIAGRPSLEFFLRVPAISALGPEATPQFNTGAFLQALHLERVHLLCGSIDLNAPAALVHFSVLGDTSPGSLFDLFGTSATSFQTLRAAPAGASISVYRLNVGALLSLFTGAFSAAVGQNRAARLNLISALLSQTVVPALGGEYAAIWRPTAGGNGARLFAMTVHPEPARSLFSGTLAPFFVPAGRDGEIRYFRFGKRPDEKGKSGSKDQSPATVRPVHPSPGGEPSDLIALTPNLLLAGQDQPFLRARARAVTAAPPRPGLAGTQRFHSARAGLPAALSGLSYLNLRAFDWSKWIGRIADRMAKNKKNPHARERAAALKKWVDGGGDAVLARHLHLVVIGAWKDDHGMHWRGHVQ